jgi:hypothetical protein
VIILSFVHGKKSFISINNTDISTSNKKVDLTRNSKNADVSTFTLEDEAYIAGLRGADLSIDGLFEPTEDNLIEGIYETSDRTLTFVYGPSGNSVGSKYLTAVALITDYNISGSVGDVVQAILKLKITGAVTLGNF